MDKDETRQAFTVSVSLWEKLKKVAKREKRSASSQVRHYLEQALEKEPD